MITSEVCWHNLSSLLLSFNSSKCPCSEQPKYLSDLRGSRDQLWELRSWVNQGVSQLIPVFPSSLFWRSSPWTGLPASLNPVEGLLLGSSPRELTPWELIPGRSLSLGRAIRGQVFPLWNWEQFVPRGPAHTYDLGLVLLHARLMCLHILDRNLT